MAGRTSALGSVSLRVCLRSAVSYSLCMADQDEQQGFEVAAAGGPGALRVSYEDRDQVAEVLRVAAGDGRLTAEELDERLERALTARTYDELAPLVTDLPAAGTGVAPLAGVLARAGSVPAKELIKIHVISSSGGRDGRWTVPARMDLMASSGQITLDFTDAVITQPTLHIDAEVQAGVIILVIKPGIVVDMDEVSVHAGQVKVDAPWDASTPVFLHVTVAGRCGSGVIVARPPQPPRPPRRSFWQWLRRAPRPRAITA
jgi:hypothetical protein